LGKLTPVTRNKLVLAQHDDPIRLLGAERGIGQWQIAHALHAGRLRTAKLRHRHLMVCRQPVGDPNKTLLGTADTLRAHALAVVGSGRLCIHEQDFHVMVRNDGSLAAVMA
jgi:hypothetical protein